MNDRLNRVAALLVGACAWCLPALAQPAATPDPAMQPARPERWTGIIEIPGQELAFDLDFRSAADGTISGDITIPSQGAVDLPLEEVSISGSGVRAVIKGIPGSPTFVGKIVGDGTSVEGQFTQAGQTFPFRWTWVGVVDSKPPAALDGFTQWADQARRDWRAPGLAIAIIQNGQVVLSEGLGVRDTTSGAPVTPDTLFAIGSCTKSFTTALLATLQESGALTFDAPVRSIIPTFKLKDAHATEHVTIRDMVTHRTGLPRHDLLWYNATFSREDMVQRLAFLEPSRELRETWQYNNLMFLTAGFVSEVVTGKTWEAGVMERLMTPLGMTASNFSVDASQQAADFAQPYEWRDDALRQMPFRNITQVGPAGSINSNLTDMIKWAGMHVSHGTWEGRRVLSRESVAELHRPQMIMSDASLHPEIISIGYAMGWMVHAYRGQVMVEHGGNIDGFSALVTLLPGKSTAVVALTNMNGSPLPRIVTYHAIDRLLEAGGKDWHAQAIAQRNLAESAGKAAKANMASVRRADTRPSHEIAEYAGEFEHPGYGTLTILQEGGALSMTYNRISAPLTHWHFDVFNAGKNPTDPTFEDTKLLFETNLDGDIASIETIVDPMVKPVVFTRKADARLLDSAYLSRFVGSYELAVQVVTISLRGNVLVASIAGQEPYDLLPSGIDSFALKGLSGFSLRFTTTDGNVTGARFIQPDGVYEAKRLTTPPTTPAATPEATAPVTP
jgi:CubicO group peptidase (beta-lactamase class C family)